MVLQRLRLSSSDAGNFSVLLDTFWVAMPRWKFLRRDYANPRLICSAFWSGNVIQAGGAFPADQYCEITLATITVSAVGVAFPHFSSYCRTINGNVLFCEFRNRYRWPRKLRPKCSSCQHKTSVGCSNKYYHRCW